MLDSVYFEDGAFIIEHASESILSNAEFRKRPTSQWFENVHWFAPLRGTDLVEFRNDPILNVMVETVELFGRLARQ